MNELSIGKNRREKFHPQSVARAFGKEPGLVIQAKNIINGLRVKGPRLGRHIICPQNIRVNALLPGGTDTPMGQTFANTPEALEFVKGMHALKRIAQPEEIAKSALYLASDLSSFTTGAALLADGGVSINRT